jgi:hypothetical protein
MEYLLPESFALGNLPRTYIRHFQRGSRNASEAGRNQVSFSQSACTFCVSLLHFLQENCYLHDTPIQLQCIGYEIEFQHCNANNVLLQKRG